MSFRVHCPDCDIVFEPPAGVWSARCPFCGKEVEVPHIHGVAVPTGYRKRVRKGAGRWVIFQAHLPRWTNSVLAVSFVMLLASALIQAWLSAHEERSAGAMRRALAAWKSAGESREPSQVVDAADRLLEAIGPDSANRILASEGLTESVVRDHRSKAVRTSWTMRFDKAIGASDEASLRVLSELTEEAGRDSDLNAERQRAVDAWLALRERLTRQALAENEAALSRGESQPCWVALVRASRVESMSIQGGERSEVLRQEVERAADRTAGKFGLSVICSMVDRTFSTNDEACRRLEPLIVADAERIGYVVGDLKDPKLNDLFREASRYRLEATISERFSRTFEDTPHRTTSLEFGFVLFEDGAEVGRRTATARTPRIPASTAIGMSRLQLSKRSDERIEKRLAEAAWETIPSPVRQALSSLPAPK
jgi:hypothetical protein